MTDWFAPFTELSAPSDDVMWTRCRVGHTKHATKLVHATVPILNRDMPMFIYDWHQYGGDKLDKWPEYCPGQDVISQTIDKTGVWERNESLLFADILQQGDPTEQVVLDFGCHIGWYATIAASFHYPVAAIDVNGENRALAMSNTWGNRSIDNRDPDVWAEIGTFLGAVDEYAPTLAADMPVRVAKIDIEGAEQHAVAMLAPTLAAGNVDYLLIEISPVFNDSYPALVQRLVDWGYEPFIVPTLKNDPEFMESPLLTVLEYNHIVNRDRWLGSLHQADVLFARKDLT